MIPRNVVAALVTAGMLGVAVMAGCSQADTQTPMPAEPDKVEEPVKAMDYPAKSVEYVIGSPSSQKGLWANGYGKVSASPDLALLEVGVRALAPTVADANGEAAEALDRMIEALTAAGLAEADIQTSSLNIRQETDGREVTRCPEAEGETEEAAAAAPDAEVSMENAMAAAVTAMVQGIGKPGMGMQDGCYTTYEQVVTGYVVSQQLTAKVRDLDSTGELIDQLVEAGGDLTRINGISFTIEDPTPLLEQAREMAIEDLLDRARQMADAAGVQLGKLEYLSESGASVREAREEFYRAAPAAMAFDQATASTPIAAGEVTVTANVTGSFGIGGNDKE